MHQGDINMTCPDAGINENIDILRGISSNFRCSPNELKEFKDKYQPISQLFPLQISVLEELKETY